MIYINIQISYLKIISLGNIKNNNHPIEKNYSGPIDEIIFISEFTSLKKKIYNFKIIEIIKIFLF